MKTFKYSTYSMITICFVMNNLMTACDSSNSTKQMVIEDMGSRDQSYDMMLVDQMPVEEADQMPVDEADQMLVDEVDQMIVDEADQMLVDEADQMLPSVSPEELWNELRMEIDQAQPQELVVMFGDQSGVRFLHEKGTTQRQAIPIASASKLVTALLVLKLVEEGRVQLSDHPQQYLSWWTTDPADPRSQITLEQLLSFTSGFIGDTGLGNEGIPCVEDAETTLDACAQQIYEDFFVNEPGESFYYGPAHMHIAAAMACAATGEDWNSLFRRLIYEPLDMNRRTNYQIPSNNNPRASGGLVATPQNYAKILISLVNNELLSENLITELARDRTPIGTQFTSVPSVADEYGDWHYALGCWRECAESEYSEVCDAPGVISSPGAFGFYPWIDQQRGYWGIVSTVIRIRGASVTVPLGQAWYPRAKQAMELLNQ